MSNNTQGRKICVVTGTRAEYGLLHQILKKIDDDQTLLLQLVVTGTHLSPEHGLTYREIESNGFVINSKLEMLLSNDTPVAVTKSMGLAVIGFADTFAQLKPDILLLLGDRYEILAAATAAMVARIPIAHIHGGELTEGLIDDAIRHSVTKMSHLHFVASGVFKQRIVQMGEDPKRVFVVGAPGVENVKKMPLLRQQKLEEKINFHLGSLSFLVTYHPVTLVEGHSEIAMNALFAALDNFPQAKIIFTMPNADTEGKNLQKAIEEYALKNKDRVKTFKSMGQHYYFSAIRHVDVVIGNSSSGLIEAPSFNTPTVNIGARQRGRLKADSVIDCEDTIQSIIKAINKAISNEFQETMKNVRNPYEQENTSSQIVQILSHCEIKNILFKSFNDLNYEVNL